MSPFAICLKSLRLSRGVKQKALAFHLGYEPSYISALERGEKGPPREDFVNRLIRGLELDEAELESLRHALATSRRQIWLPAKAREQEYALIHRLEPQLGQLHSLQVELIELALRLPSVFAGPRQSS